MMLQSDKFMEQECIPVGCIPPAAVAIGGVSNRHPPPQTTQPQGPGTPWDQAPSQTRYHLEQAPPRPDTPGSDTSLEQVAPGSRHPPVDRHRSVNILPSPKLRLRAVVKMILDIH